MFVRHRASPNNAAATRFGLELVLPVSRLNCKPAHSGFGNMSFNAIIWAFKQVAPSREKLVLLALANRANDRDECWPSMGKVAIDCGMSRHTVLRAVAKLKELGLIETRQNSRKHGKSSLTYRLVRKPGHSFEDVADCYTDVLQIATSPVAV